MLQYLFGISPSLLIFPGNVSIFPLGCIDWQLHAPSLVHFQLGLAFSWIVEVLHVFKNNMHIIMRIHNIVDSMYT